MLRKLAGFMLAVDQVSIDFDIENPPAAFDQFDFNSVLVLDCVCQTGSFGLVVSLHTVGD